MRNTKFSIDLDTGNFILSSTEVIYEGMGLPSIELPLKVIESHLFESEWDFDNNLIRFQMDGEDAFEHLTNVRSPFYAMANVAKNHQLSVMRYERT